MREQHTGERYLHLGSSVQPDWIRCGEWESDTELRRGFIASIRQPFGHGAISPGRPTQRFEIGALSQPFCG